ncbi:Pepco domain-containing protein [Limnospira platensis CENA597]|uniref:Pepco domain-containing protein n=1 Tax=Limnospira platensis TaxID=118562 RepID=UPI003DA060F2
MSEIIQIPKSIWIITQDSPTPSTSPDTPTESQTHRVAVPAHKMQQNMSQFLLVIGDVFLQAEQQAFQMQQASGNSQKSPMQLDQVELSVRINGNGEVSLCSDNFDHGTIKLTFKRRKT